VGGAGAYGIIAVASALTPLTVAGNATRTSIDYADFISIMLTGVSLILGALGFVVAILAFIGWNSIGDRVSSLATSFLKDGLKEGGELRSLIRNEAKDIIFRDIEPVDIEFEDAPDGEKEK
jgi:hypothetical protein